MMEKLSQLINVCVGVNQWKPIKVSKTGPNISHFFADDLILFTEATPSNCKLMKRCMDSFCNISAQKVSYKKSYVYVSKNVGHVMANHLVNVCWSPLTADLGKYLGVPLMYGKVNQRTYSYLVD